MSMGSCMEAPVEGGRADAARGGYRFPSTTTGTHQMAGPVCCVACISTSVTLTHHSDQFDRQDARLTCTLLGRNVRCIAAATACLRDIDKWRPTEVASLVLLKFHVDTWGVAHGVLAEVASATTPQSSTAGPCCEHSCPLSAVWHLSPTETIGSAAGCDVQGRCWPSALKLQYGTLARYVRQ